MIQIRKLFHVLVLAGPVLASQPAAAQDAGFEPGARLNVGMTFGGAGGHALQLNGVPLAPASIPGAHAKESGDRDAGWSPAAVILALGVGLALIVYVAGDAAEDLNDDNKDNGLP
jgi:hypothetical protein